MERDGNNIVINVDPIIKPNHIDFVFYYLYMLGEGGKVKKYMDMFMDDIEWKHTFVLAVNSLCKYLCIDPIPGVAYKNRWVDEAISCYERLELPPILEQEFIGDKDELAKGCHLVFICALYGYRFNIFEDKVEFTNGKTAISVHIGDSLMPLYEHIFANGPTPRIDEPSCYDHSDSFGSVTLDDLNRIYECEMSRWCYVGALDVCDIDATKKYEIWKDLVDRANKHLMEQYMLLSGEGSDTV
jgi:hypothetical protein